MENSIEQQDQIPLFVVDARNRYGKDHGSGCQIGFKSQRAFSWQSRDLTLGTTYCTSSRDCGKRVAQCVRNGSTHRQKSISSSVLLGAIICSKKRTANLFVNFRSKVRQQTIRSFHLFVVFGDIFEKVERPDRLLPDFRAEVDEEIRSALLG